jgi:hypothetical protein
MLVNLLKARSLALTSGGLTVYDSHYLPDMTYGKFLIYNGLKPVYIMDLFDNDHKGFKEYIELHETDVCLTTKRILHLNSLNHLSVSEHVWWMFRFGKETSLQFELEKFPVDYWRRAKQNL